MQEELTSDVVALAANLLFFAMLWWMLLDVVRRGQSWGRWLGLLFLLPLLAMAAWLYKRRRLALAAVVSRRSKAMLALVAAALVVLPNGVAAVADAVATNVVQLAHVEGSSMAPTLLNRDRLVVDKRAYRTAEPAVGDIVMFRYPLDPRKAFVERVVALGGDEVRIVNGDLYRNGTVVTETFTAPDRRGDGDWGPAIVPMGTLFVMGDHRNNSSDSRHWGPVPREDVLGRVTSRWWPFSRRRRF